MKMRCSLLANMHRYAIDDVYLSDGTFIPKNSMLTVSQEVLWDEKVYPDPHTWDAYRFYRLRNQCQTTRGAQFITTSPEHFVFGHGTHACPGRLFAAHEIKIMVIILVRQLDWRLPNGADPPAAICQGFNLFRDPSQKVEYRQRQE